MFLMNKVSICITTYNRADSLPLTLDSILQQSFKDFELIISDDNSTDATQEVCKTFCEKDSRIKYYRNPQNLKMPGNLNNAISRASGEYIANLHDGDVYRDDLIQKWCSLLDKHSDALFVFNQYMGYDKHGKLHIDDHKLEEVNEGTVLFEHYLKTLTSATWGTVMARRSAYEKFGLFNAEYGFISDVEMWMRLGLHGKVCYVNEPLIELTQREKSHPYFLPHWKVFCINIRIILEYYHLYKSKINDLENRFPINILFRKIERSALYDMMLLIKYKNLLRIREGLYVFRHLPLIRLQRISKLFQFLKPAEPAYLPDIVLLSDQINNLKKTVSNKAVIFHILLFPGIHFIEILNQ